MTGIARAVTVGRGITSERGTVGRLRAAAGDVLDDATVRELEDAFRFLWGVRLRHQVERAAAGAEPDDRVDPRALGPVSRPALREAFRVDPASAARDRDRVRRSRRLSAGVVRRS